MLRQNRYKSNAIWDKSNFEDTSRAHVAFELAFLHGFCKWSPSQFQWKSSLPAACGTKSERSSKIDLTAKTKSNLIVRRPTRQQSTAHLGKVVHHSFIGKWAFYCNGAGDLLRDAAHETELFFWMLSWSQLTWTIYLINAMPQIKTLMFLDMSVCGSSQFRCPNGECISGVFRCFGGRHCSDGADEYGCG